MQHISRRQALIGLGALTFVVAGCADDEVPKKAADSANKAGAMASFGVNQQFKATEAVSFDVLYNNHPFYPLKNDWLFWQELTKRTNVTLKPVAVPLSDYEKKRGLLVGSGQAPLIIPKTYHPSEEAFVASGAILPVSDYLDLMPNFKDKVAKWKLEPELNTLRQSDGKFYLLPGIHESPWVDYSLAVRTDILDKHGLALPKTWEELYTVLKALKKEYPDLYPMTDRWGVPTPGGNLIKLVAQAYGAKGGWEYQHATWDAAAGKFAYTGAMPQYKQAIEYLHKLVDEKLLDPESFTQQDEQAKQKFNSGKSFVISTNAQTMINDYRPTLTKLVPDAKIVKIPVPMGPVGEYKIQTRLENGVMISKKALENKNFVAMMQFVDWLYYSDQGQEFAKWGVEGTTYTKDASGKFTLNKDIDFIGLNAGAPKHLQKDFGFSNGVFAYGGPTKLVQSTFSEEELEFQNVMNARQLWPVEPPHPFNDVEREQATLWETPLKDFVTQQTLKFILGERDLSEWDAYVKELEGKNMTAYVNLVNTAYERFKKEHG
ncbi:putative aldouronate transport system substrate-binding protein [Nonomuraea polychroma]|uniref:Putative aldouronate transport system substrate-binding protein n=1 Tax=Nonomuraea polychroma TaxID=46176 RepID=A0A438M7F1_9ACTN|nr:extracellular solute-binding protein [Nonomuraea polychroma]RVX41632.1 putative aldouronate transport system substrate-binding protein [Nonomuraea polychroma]